MIRTTSKMPPSGGTLRSADVPVRTVSQVVGKVVLEVMKLRQSLAEKIATARRDEQRQGSCRTGRECRSARHQRAGHYCHGIQ
jgi:hypothetical protein